MFLLDGKPLSPDVAFVTTDGTQYPANWLRLASPEERLAIGITEAPDPEQYDQRFYWGPGIPKQLEDLTETPEGSTEPVTTFGLKHQWVSQVKATAGSLLSQTDWKVVRASEGVKPVDPDTLSFRESIRAYSDQLEASIASCETVESLIEVVTNQTWPTQEQ